MKRVTITIEPDGQTVIDYAGFHGKGCTEHLDDLLDDLAQGGVTLTSRKTTIKREFHEQVEEREEARVRG